MKKLILFAFVAVLLTACGTNKPDNKVYGTDSQQVGWEPQGPGKEPAPVILETVGLKPTWGQANHMASLRGDHTIWNIIGVILLALLVAGIYGAATDAKWFPKLDPKALGAILFVIGALCITSFKWQAASIMWNNYKFVPKQQYEKAMKETGSTKQIWDSLTNGCHITWGPYNCYK